MKKLYIPIIAIFLIITSCTPGVVIDKEAETMAIQTVVESMFKAIANSDTAELKTFLCDDFLAYDLNQVMKLEDLSNAVAGLSQMGYSDISYQLEPLESYIFENNAVVFFKTSGTAKIGGQDLKMEFFENYLMMKSEDVWKIKFFHSTMVPPPAPAGVVE